MNNRLIEDYHKCFASIQCFKNLARAYGNLHLSLDDTHPKAFIESSKLRERDVEITWRLDGLYGYTDGGEFLVPIELLCDKEAWRDSIQAEVDAQRLKEKQVRDAQIEKRRLQEIEAAKKLLQDEGIIDLC
jgi:hypothetical protein